MVVALTAVWTSFAGLVNAVSDLKNTNSEVRGAIDRLGDRIGTLADVTRVSLRALEKSIEENAKRIERHERQLQSLRDDTKWPRPGRSVE